MKKNKNLFESCRKYLDTTIVPVPGQKGMYYDIDYPDFIYSERELWRRISSVRNSTTNAARDCSKKKRNRKIRYTEIEQDPNTKIDTWEWN